jgi:translation initiation factor IF-2
MQKSKKEKVVTAKRPKLKPVKAAKTPTKTVKPKPGARQVAKVKEKTPAIVYPKRKAWVSKKQIAPTLGGIVETQKIAILPVETPALRVIHKEAVPKEKAIKEELKKEAIKKPDLKRAPAKDLLVEEVKKEIPEVALKVTPPILLKELELKLPISVKDLSVKLQEKPSILIKKLMDSNIMAAINQLLSREAVEKICRDYGFQIKEEQDEEETIISMHREVDSPEVLKPRSPIVTIMGHVDHGKTSILDAIRKTKVVESEHGGITQHIGAYKVALPAGEITFLDTPGHEAFTAMRARGAKVTDIVILVVAADDGVMPQTQEAIDHARAAGVPIIVAINKIDKPQADIDRVKKQLSAFNLTAEDWGGETITVAVSAKTGEGIDTLLEMILLEAEMLELRANPKRLARGVVLESKLVKNKGPVATLLIQNGTLQLNENIIVGTFSGKIRAMFNDRGQTVTEAYPSTPVEVLGISGVAQAGEQFFVVENEKTAKELALKRQERERQMQMLPVKRLGLEDLYTQIKEGKLKELNLVIKADAQGSIGAIKESLNKINSLEVKLNIIHDGVGAINSSDVVLALASQALILGFNSTPDEVAKLLIQKEGQEVRTYNVIYELVNEVKAALEGMLEPRLKKIFLGKAEVRKIFRLSSSGVIAGCFVSKGKINRSLAVSLVRNGAVVHEGEISSLKRFKDDVREVEEGFECGIALKGHSDIVEGDVIEAYQIQKIARTLE